MMVTPFVHREGTLFGMSLCFGNPINDCYHLELDVDVTGEVMHPRKDEPCTGTASEPKLASADSPLASLTCR